MSALFKIQIARYPKIPQMLSVSNSRRGMLLPTVQSLELAEEYGLKLFIRQKK